LQQTEEKMLQKKLSELKPGEKATIVKVQGSRALRRRLLDMGVIRGTEIEMVRKSPLGDPLEFLVKGYNLSLRKTECENVYVEVKP